MLRRSLVSLLPLIGAVLSGRHGEIDNRDIAAGQNDTFYDYIVVGAGPTGIIAADRLSETGKKVLLIERGGPSTAATGGTDVAPWANSTRLTRFDIPGLYEAMYQGDNQYWWCDDMDVHTGCVIGGNSAINGMLYWYPTDFEYSTSNGWPSGWQSVSTYLDKLKARLPSTDNPSRDGKYYLGQVHDVIGSILQKQGYTGIIGNDQRNNKDHVYTHTNYFIQNQTRTGPMDTYLQSARARPNFTLLSRTSVVSVVRNGSHITGVQTNDTTGGNNGIINVTPATGRVVLAAGAFGTAKILFQSGIGPTDMLSLAAKNSTVSQYMPPSSQYINLPVGINVTDNPSVRVVFTHPSVDSYNSWSNMYTNPRPADAAQYVSDRSGPLSGPSARANFWRAYNATDGRTRYVQGTCRPGGSLPGGSTYNISNVFFCTIYVSTGLTSVGRIGIDSSLRGVVLQEPYFTDPADKDVLVSGVSDFLSTYQQVPDLQLALPNSSTSISAHVDSTASGSNHWVGSTRIGTDSWTSVVDSNTKVWFTDNLFVVDAGIYPGVATGNPVGSLMVMAEMAADKIRGSTGGGGSSSLGNHAGSSLHNGLFFGYIVSLVVMYCMM